MLKQLAEAQGLLRYLLKIKLLLTFSHISIVVLARLGIFLQIGSHI